MNLEESVKLMRNLVYPGHFIRIHLTPDDYSKHAGDMYELRTLIGRHLMLYGVPVIMDNKLDESMFLIDMPGGYEMDENEIVSEYTYHQVFVKADLSYMDGIQDKIS